LKWLDGCEEGCPVAGCGSEDLEVFEDFEDLFLLAEGRKGFIFIITPNICYLKPPHSSEKQYLTCCWTGEKMSDKCDDVTKNVAE
jgi:hypothetical protein